MSNPDEVTVIRPTHGWRGIDVRELWRFRELLLVLVERDIRVRYKQTVLGAFWAIIPPVLTMIVFSIVFGRFAKIPSDGAPYPLFVFAALVPWTLFANAFSAASGSLVGSANLISKVYFPRLIVPFSGVGAPLLDAAIACLILLGMVVIVGTGLSIRLLLVPLLLLVIALTAVGAGALIAALTVKYRDFRHTVPFLTQFWMFASPVAYPMSIIPDHLLWVFYLNPMAGFIETFRAVCLDRPIPTGAALSAIVVSTAMVIAGVAYFERVERRIADTI